VAPPQLVADAWAHHDYTTIGPSGATDHLATLALEPAVRERLLVRTRGILRTNYPILETWLRGFGETFSWIAPRAGAICFTRYRPALNGDDLVERVRASESVLLVPGEHFGMPGYLRFGFGNEGGELGQALAAAAAGLRKAFGD
jgi:aspartate/methionine/tyrosine aminotransferase